MAGASSANRVLYSSIVDSARGHQRSRTYASALLFQGEVGTSSALFYLTLIHFDDQFRATAEVKVARESSFRARSI
jgi:hypothetical protein